MLRRLLLPASLLVATVVQAQSVPSAPPPSDSWSRPATAASASYAGEQPAAAGSAHGSHFKFKERNPYEPAHNAAQEQSGKAAVGSMGMDRNGRPAVNCPQTPMDPACH